MQGGGRGASGQHVPPQECGNKKCNKVELKIKKVLRKERKRRYDKTTFTKDIALRAKKKETAATD